MIAQIQIPEEIKEELEEMVESLKAFFEEMNANPTINQPQIDEDGTIYIYFEFENHVKLSEEQFSKFREMLDNLVFYNANGAENQINNFIGYKEWLIEDEFRHLYKDIVIYLKYHRVVTGGKTIIYLDHVTVAANTTHYEENEEESEREKEESMD